MKRQRYASSSTVLEHAQQDSSVLEKDEFWKMFSAMIFLAENKKIIWVISFSAASCCS